ncbi:hypothetical protein MPSEU_000992000 [Mayamaea pseudoterrestris]|nr:hypothetical protein MPSEU_000992000 [Mayamaea pseudoterrestris]
MSSQVARIAAAVLLLHHYAHSADESNLTEQPLECGLYLAESTIKGAGMGIFAGKEYNVGQDVGRGDVCIPFVDMYWHNDDNFFPNPFYNYFWNGGSMGMHFETDTGDIEAYCPGLDCAINCHQGLLNVGKSFPDYDEGKLHRSLDPGAGTFTPYHNGTTKVIRDIPAGGELFKDYGPDWFDHRYHIFGQMPFADNYDDARELLQSMVELKTFKQHEPVLADLYQLMRGLSKKDLYDSRTLNALPERLEDAIEATKPLKDLGSILQPSYTHSLAYLQEHGKCIDHLVPKQSTISQANRGAFATRNLPKGTIVTASPLHHVPDKKFANMYNFAQVDGTWMRVMDQIVGKQLVLNYCFSHPATTLMLCPYGSQINYINHDRERANVRVQWATNFAVGHNQSVVDHGDFEFLRSTERPVLAFDYVAIKDIAEGEEVFLDYGDDWIKAWEAHVATFRPVTGADKYTSAHQWDREMRDALIRTQYEQTFDPYPAHMEIRCHSGLMNAHGMVDYEWYPNDYGLPCQVTSRIEENNTHLYTVDLIWEAGKNGRDTEYRMERAGVPRKSIHFFNRHHTTDIHLPNAFRHPIGIPDDILPTGWKNVKMGGDDRITSLLDTRVTQEQMSNFAVVDSDLYDGDDDEIDNDDDNDNGDEDDDEDDGVGNDASSIADYDEL